MRETTIDHADDVRAEMPAGNGEDECVLQPVSEAVAPRLRCSNCHFERQYTFWYRQLGFRERVINYCPGCGMRILGMAGALGGGIDA